MGVLGNSHNSMISGNTVQMSGECVSPHLASTHSTRCNATVRQHGIRAAVTVQSRHVQYIAISVQCSTVLLQMLGPVCCKHCCISTTVTNVAKKLTSCRRCMQCLQVTFCKFQIHGHHSQHHAVKPVGAHLRFASARACCCAWRGCGAAPQALCQPAAPGACWPAQPWLWCTGHL